MYKINIQLVKTFVLVVALSSCKHDAANVQPNTQCAVNTIGTVSFSKNIIPIFEASCSLSGCHTGSMPAGSLNLDSSVAYSQLSQPGSAYIDTTDPENSLLISRMTSTTQPMPPSGVLDSCTIEIIAKWMSQGAANN